MTFIRSSTKALYHIGILVVVGSLIRDYRSIYIGDQCQGHKDGVDPTPSTTYNWHCGLLLPSTNHTHSRESSILPSLILHAAAASVPCDCNFGAVVHSKPFCQCQCQGEYLPPKCLYLPRDEGVRVDVWFNVTQEKFISKRVVKVLSENVESAAPFQFKRAYMGTYGTTLCATFTTNGAGVYNLLALFSHHHQQLPKWMVDAHIIDVFDATLDKVAGDESRRKSSEAYLGYEDIDLFVYEGFQLSLTSCIYLGLCLLVVLLLWMCECCCCLSNTSESVMEAIHAGKLKSVSEGQQKQEKQKPSSPKEQKPSSPQKQPSSSSPSKKRKYAPSKEPRTDHPDSVYKTETD